ncbi:hypothetical protein [Paenisporosarcina sp. TG20]|uniref:hypothetical protein n=1 Tax=Paenisporosarcina sp. TG20 TaxID=1211706 RepID=UPI00031D6FF6|nr:hypothetical protein [Paenisporosarcina sp. TG20]
MGFSIWQDDDYYKLKLLTDKLLEKVNQKLKITLPESYLEILKDTRICFSGNELINSSLSNTVSRLLWTAAL